MRSLTGGARLNMWNATWPFAKLSASKEGVVLKVAIFGEYDLHVSQIVAVKKYTMIPFIGWGIRIHHRVGRFPKKMIFWYLGFPSTVLEFLRDEGFPEAKLEPNPSSQPTPPSRRG
jgi:hypothetical protein